MDKITIINNIVHELYEDFSPKESEFSVGLNDAIELFYELVTTPIGDKNLDGMPSTLFEAIDNFYQSDLGRKRIYIGTIANAFDAIIKKIFFLADPPKFTTAINSKWMLKKLVENCGILCSNDFSILWDSPTPITDTTGFPKHLQITYQTRNSVHGAINWSQIQLSTRYTACLMTYVFTVLKNYTPLKNGIANFVKTQQEKQLNIGVDLKTYLTSLSTKIKNEPTYPKKRYTDLEGEENIDLIYDDADREIEENMSMMYDSDEDDTEEEDKEEDEQKEDYYNKQQGEKRKGKISELRKIIPQMIIRGKPGMGKTTTLRYLVLCDTEMQQPVPFLFYLKNYQSAKGDILTQIAKRNNFDPIWLEEYLKNGFGALYLDGLNEIIDAKEREKLKANIEELAAMGINMLVSSREKAYDTDRFKIPVFDLKPLNLLQITEYVRKAYGKKTIELQTEGVKTPYTPETFAELLQKNTKLYNLCQNPFFLRMYVDVVRQIQQFPQNTGLLLRTFVKGSIQNGTKIGGLLGREERKPDKTHWLDDRDTYETLIEHLAYETRRQKKVAFSRRTALALMAVPNQLYFGSNVDLGRLIEDLKDLYLLEEENDQKQLSFVHELYQEYFAAEALTHLHQQTPNLVATLAAQSNWIEPLILFDGLLQNNIATFKQISGVNSETGARALAASLETQAEKRQINLKDAQTDAQNFKNPNASARGFMALLYLGEYPSITEIVETVENPNKIHQQIMQGIVQSCPTEQLFDFLRLLSDLTKNTKQLLNWAVAAIEEDFSAGSETEKSNNLINYWLQKPKYENLAIALFSKLREQNPLLIETIIEKAIGLNQLPAAAQLIEKYQVQEKYAEKLIEKAIEIKHLRLAAQLIEKYQLQEKDAEELIEKTIELNQLSLAAQLIEKYQLQEKYAIDFLIEKAIEFNQLPAAAKLIEKYQLQEKYAEKLIEKAIELKQLWLAAQLIEKYQLQEKYAIDFLIEKAIEINKLSLAAELVEKYQLQEKYAEKLIEKAIETTQLSLAAKLIEKYQLQEKYSIDFLIEKVIKLQQLPLAAKLIEKYQLQEKYSIDFLIEKAIETKQLILAKKLLKKYQLQEKYAEKLIEKAIEINQLLVAAQSIEKYQLQEKDAEKLIEKTIEVKQFPLAAQLIEKYQLQEKYAEKLIEKAIEDKQLILAKKLIKKYQLQEKYGDRVPVPLEIGTTIVTCEITKIISSYVFVKIAGDSRRANIYIGELANYRIPNISEFEYQGVKLHIGQTLRALVIGIDEQNRVQLSLKNLP